MIKLNNKFESLRRELLKDAYNLEDKVTINGQFKKDFLFNRTYYLFFNEGENNFWTIFYANEKGNKY